MSIKEYRINPTPREKLLEAIQKWLDCKNVIILDPSNSFFNLFSRLLIDCQVSGKFTSDAYLAALAIENGARLASNDKGFSRFESEGLQWFNPIKESTPANKYYPKPKKIKK